MYELSIRSRSSIDQLTFPLEASIKFPRLRECNVVSQERWGEDNGTHSKYGYGRERNLLGENSRKIWKKEKWSASQFVSLGSRVLKTTCQLNQRDLPHN